MKTNNYQYQFYDKFYLSTEGYYFIYRLDKYNPFIIRAVLWSIQKNKEVSSIKVSIEDNIEATHTDVINHFESELFLNKIK